LGHDDGEGWSLDCLFGNVGGDMVALGVLDELGNTYVECQLGERGWERGVLGGGNVTQAHGLIYLGRMYHKHLTKVMFT